jgi:hypothetical protein
MASSQRFCSSKAIAAEQIVHLAPDHPFTTRSVGQGQTGLGGGLRWKRASQNGLKSQGLQSISGQNGGGFVELDVARRPPATEIIVVHGRQIVMDQRIAVDHFQRSGRPQRGLRIAADSFASEHAEDWAQAFSGG